jgi:predicted SAM-dependent methyltransferase
MLDFTNTKISVRRPILSYSKIQGIVSFFIRGRALNLKRPGLVLDVGCGPNNSPEKLNLDYDWRPGIDICCDITKGLPVPDHYVSSIFTEHCFEHIPFASTAFVLREFGRVLQPGGTVRIVVPDLAIYVQCYQRGLRMPYGENETPAMSINRIMRAHGHQFIYDFDTLKPMLERAGFSQIEKMGFGIGTLGHLDAASRQVESLYVEGIVSAQ